VSFRWPFSEILELIDATLREFLWQNVVLLDTFPHFADRGVAPLNEAINSP
jgi:hypothetical protein